jgi:16S rRNA (guanine527-N7)-methyltransferase
MWDSLPEGAENRLRRFERLLREKAVPVGGVGRGDSPRLWERHILDSLRGVSCLVASDQQVVDMGSGAGLPGIPLAIAEPLRHFTLVERSPKKAGFLEFTVEELHLENVYVEAGPIGEITSRADVCTARALAPPAQSWRLAQSLLRPEGRLLYYAGRSWDEREFGAQAPGVYARVCETGHFDWQGPIVMMARRT